VILVDTGPLAAATLSGDVNQATGSPLSSGSARPTERSWDPRRPGVRRRPLLAIVAAQAAAISPPGVVAVLALTDLAGGVDQARREPPRWLHAAGTALAHDLEPRS
jgi:hypothetical protein